MNLDKAMKRIIQLEEALMLMVYQYCVTDDRLDHRYMCAGEHAFAALGLSNGDRVEMLENMLERAERNTDALYTRTPFRPQMDLAGLSRYARDKGVSVRDLSEKEKNQFGVFTQDFQA